MPIKAIIEFKDGRWAIHSSDVKEVSKEFKPGFYTSRTDNQGNLIVKTKEIAEIHLPFPNQSVANVMSYCEEFIKPEFREKVNKIGFVHKLGILLYGVAGVGKTAFFNYLANEMVKNHNAIVFYCNSMNELSTSVGMIHSIREIQDNVMIIIADEFERWTKDSESEIKNYLDGVDSIDNTMFLAATNYIQKIPDTLKDRPSRFKVVLEMKGIEDEDIIYNLIKEKSDLIGLFKDKQIKKIARELAKQSPTLDQVKNTILDSIVNIELKIEEKRKIGF